MAEMTGKTAALRQPGLLNRRRVKNSTGGSNPPLSASKPFISPLLGISSQRRFARQDFMILGFERQKKKFSPLLFPATYEDLRQNRSELPSQLRWLCFVIRVKKSDTPFWVMRLSKTSGRRTPTRLGGWTCRLP